MKTKTSGSVISTLLFAGALGFSGSVQASLTTYASDAAWSGAVGTQTTTTIPDVAPGSYVYIGQGTASVTYGGVTFSQSGTLGNGYFYNIGSGYFGNTEAVLSSQEQSIGVANILITLPSPVTAFALNLGYGTFFGGSVTFTLGNGDTFTQGSEDNVNYTTPGFAGATDTAPFTTILVTTGDEGLNINNLVTADGLTSPVPEPTTLISGAVMLLPFGSSAVRQIRKKMQAA
ncbi:MAG TPA: hypothetical protein VMR33_15515 [Candidatus Baltobacteraceae bacterium]|jgi:hypothetical protein|nr:hypothetical protein [Candidatus Baltobacteraceae bacterium]